MAAKPMLPKMLHACTRDFCMHTLCASAVGGSKVTADREVLSMQCEPQRAQSHCQWSVAGESLQAEHLWQEHLCALSPPPAHSAHRPGVLLDHSAIHLQRHCLAHQWQQQVARSQAHWLQLWHDGVPTHTHAVRALIRRPRCCT